MLLCNCVQIIHPRQKVFEKQERRASLIALNYARLIEAIDFSIFLEKNGNPHVRHLKIRPNFLEINRVSLFVDNFLSFGYR